MSKARGKLVERLKSPRQRPREGMFLLEGIRSVREVLRAPRRLEVKFCLVSRRLEETESGRGLGAQLVDAPFHVAQVSDEELDALSDTERSQGVLLVAAEPAASLQDLEGIRPIRLLLLEGVQDPGNVGTLVRAAWAFGLHAVLALEGTADPWSPKSVRAAAGAMAHVPLVRVPWAEVQAWLADRRVPLLAADGGGEDVRHVRPLESWALAVGNEGAGLRPELLAAADRSLAIAMARGVDSLNAAVAGAILLFALTPEPGKSGCTP